MTDTRLVSAIRAATAVMERAAIDMQLDAAMDRFQRLLRERPLERHYNPDWRSQPRAPRGDSDGGQWTRMSGGEGDRVALTDGGVRDPRRPARRLPPAALRAESPTDLTDPRVISDATPDAGWEPGEQYAQARLPRTGAGGRGAVRGSGITARGTVRIGEREFPLEPGTATQLELLTMQRNYEVARVREIEPNWRPREIMYETVEALISATRDEIYEAHARYLELQNAGVCPGPFAGDSIPARGAGRDFRVAERSTINLLGSQTGCHTCGATYPGTRLGNWVPDHQLPSAINQLGRPQRLYPQCLDCSLRQGGWITNHKGNFK